MKKIDKILNFILGLAFIVIIAGGWVFGISVYREVSKLEKQQQEEMEKLEMQLDEVFQEVGDYIGELEARIAELEETITSSDYEKLQRYLTIYEPVLEAQHDLATGKITLVEYNERINHLANQWEEIIYDYIPSLVERLEELEDIANAFDDLEDALEKALNEINARLKALESD